MTAEDVPDWVLCERLIRSTLSVEQSRVIDGPPVWDLEPPQREEFDSPEQYVRALGDYANRVLAVRCRCLFVVSDED